MLKRCKICGKDFESKTSGQVCDSCKIRTCVICGKTFKAQWPYTQKTCSEECKRKNLPRLAPQKVRICKECRKEFYPITKNQQYCDDIHYRNCVICGKSFIVDVHLTALPKTCSKDCASKLKCHTWESNLGVDNPAKSSQVQQKIRQTSLERYGAEHHMQTTEGKENFKQSYLDKHGVDHPFKDPEVRQKISETIKSKYGANTSLDIPHVRSQTAERYYCNPTRLQQAAQKRSETRSALVSSDGTYFDSRYELDVYEFCLRNNLQIERQIPISYEHGGTTHTTFIDFKIDGILFEIKGSHLLNGCYDHAPYMVPISKKLEVYRDNSVVVITSDDAQNLFGTPNSKTSNGLKYVSRYGNSLIGVDISLFQNPKFPYREDRPKCFYDVKVKNQKSAYEAFYDESLRWKMIKNRIEYAGGFIGSKQILTALNVTRVCKQPSWFDKKFAKQLINKYIHTECIVDLFAGWGTRHDAAKECNIQYIGIDANPELVAWHRDCGRSINLGDALQYTYAGRDCSVFICPPYNDIEVYFDGQNVEYTQCEWLSVVMKNVPNAREYLMVCKVVDPGWEKYVVETVKNRSHFGTNVESVIYVTTDATPMSDVESL